MLSNTAASTVWPKFKTNESKEFASILTTTVFWKTTLIRWMKQWLRGNKTVCLGRGIRTRVRSLHSKMFLRHCFRFNICTYHLYLKKNCGDDSSFSCGKVFMWSRLWHETIYSVFFVMLFDKVCTQICNNNIKRDK